MPDDFLDVLAPFDAILLGAVGWPARLPDHITLAPLVTIRQAFDQYACVRPARLFPGVKSVLAGKRPGEIDFVVIRENSEGEYVDNGGRLQRGTPDEVAVQTAMHTRARRRADSALRVRTGPHAAPPDADDGHQVERPAVRLRACGTKCSRSCAPQYPDVADRAAALRRRDDEPRPLAGEVRRRSWPRICSATC